MNSKILGICLVAILLIVAGCGSNQTATQGSTPDSMEKTTTSGETKEFTMTAKKWEFEPSTITVNNGDRVKLVINSVDVRHGMAIPEFNVNEILEPGEINTIEFVADKTGTFDFFCSVRCGSGHSEMRGKLIVN